MTRLFDHADVAGADGWQLDSDSNLATLGERSWLDVAVKENSMGGKRFMDDGRSLYEYGEEFLVACPSCGAMARVGPPETARRALSPTLIAPRTVSCTGCAFRQHWRGSQLSINGPKDWYFGLPLWLQISCCGNVLWAYNLAHLEFIENYVSATLRPRRPWRTRSAASMLPQWVTAAKHRAAVLTAVERLRARCA